MCNCRSIILLVFVFCITQKIKAQENLHHFFRHITEADGLLHNNVYSIAQDGKGFIWIANANGLQRYDGSRFVYYPEMLSDPSKGFTFSADMYADKKNNLLWLIKNRIIVEKMELDNKNFTTFTREQLSDDTSFIFNSYRDGNNEEWLLSTNAVYRYDSITRKYIPFNLSNGPAYANQSSFISSENNGNYTWVMRGSQLNLFDRKNKAVYSNNFNPGHHPLLAWKILGTGKQFARYFMVDSKQNIWVTTWGNFFYRYDRVTQKISTYSLSSVKSKQEGRKSSDVGLLINSMIEDHNHKIWIGTENAGLLCYNEQRDNFDYDIIEEKNAGSIQYNYHINSLFQDREENIWIGTDRGISIFNPYKQFFKSIRHEENDLSNSISKSEIISSIQIPNGDIYIGTWGGGMTVYDSNFLFKKNIIYKTPTENNFVWSFVQFDKQTLWIGCQHGYLMHYNTLTGAMQNSQPPEMEKSTIRCMVKDNYGNIYFGLHNGKIAKWNAEKNEFMASGDSVRFNSGILNIFIDKAEQCWVSTEAGFKKFDPDKMKFIKTWLPGKNNDGFLGSAPEGIEELNDSVLMIGSDYGGLNFFNKKTERFSHLTVSDGLPSNNVYAIKKDPYGYVWITTDYGLYKFLPGDKRFIPYGIEPGVINSSFESPYFYPLKDGRWLTSTTTEAICFFPQPGDNKDVNPAKTEITGFRLFGKAMQIDSLLYNNKPLCLSYKENFFTIEFASLNFSSLQQTNYYYKLDGVDKDWVNSGTKRFANYTDLHPGDYVFFVKAENGYEPGKETSFRVTIAPPFWKTWWFITLVALCAFVIIYSFIKWRIKNINAIAAEKLKVQQLSAEHYKTQLELEQIINYFSSSLIDKNTVNDVLWDVAKNLIGKLGFVDCMMYLWNDDKTKMVQKAGFGPKGSAQEIFDQPFDVLPGQGVVGYVIATKEAVLIPDTSKDSRYRPDEISRLSEITVPVIYNNELIGVIDSEHHEKNFFTRQHLQILNTIATLVADKIKSIEAAQLLQHARIEVYSINEQLSKARLEALRSQMNPHFIFNCINSIDALIQSNDKYNATVYLNKFAKLLRGILDSSKQNTVSLANDLDTLKLYIELEQFRHEDKFTAEIQADDDLLQDDYKVPPLIIQPFVENAILHGLRYRNDHDGRLSISINRQGSYIKYLVEDNGVGRNNLMNYVQKNKLSYGIDMSNERVKFFNREEKASVQITDLFSKGKPSGTKVEVYLKVDEC